MEWWNGRMDFFSHSLFACLRTNYCQEYITQSRGVYNSLHRYSRKYQNKNWPGQVA